MTLFALSLFALAHVPGSAETLASPAIAFEQEPTSITFSVDGKQIATYVYADEEIPRPYFKGLRTLDGVQVTRHHPPMENEPQDHATYHPGLWMAFGDVSGADFWRNKSVVRHMAFLQEPQIDNTGVRFSVLNHYFNGDKAILRERCEYVLLLWPHWVGSQAWLLNIHSRLEPMEEAVVFGDQEEMGLGVRVSLPLMVKNGGRILNSFGHQNEAEVWGRQAAWADYGGKVGNSWAGIALFSERENFRIPWFHARDYGLLVANPFGRNAFTKDVKSEVKVEPGKTLDLQFGLLVYSREATKVIGGTLAVPSTGTEIQHQYEEYLELAAQLADCQRAEKP